MTIHSPSSVGIMKLIGRQTSIDRQGVGYLSRALALSFPHTPHLLNPLLRTQIVSRHHRALYCSYRRRILLLVHRINVNPCLMPCNQRTRQCASLHQEAEEPLPHEICLFRPFLELTHDDPEVLNLTSSLTLRLIGRSWNRG